MGYYHSLKSINDLYRSCDSCPYQETSLPLCNWSIMDLPIWPFFPQEEGKKILHRFSNLWLCVAICSEVGQRVKERRMCTSLLACMCACCFLNRPAAGVQSSKVSAKPACEGKDIYRPDTKESIDRCWSCFSWITSKPIIQSCSKETASLSQLRWREALKRQNNNNNQ